MNKKAEVPWILITMIIAVIAAVILLYIFRQGVDNGSSTLNSLGKCGSASLGEGKCASPEQIKTMNCKLVLDICDTTKNEKCCIS
ncbi:hypothetical protein HZB02_00995 [Candidatus Woesearchaeota archaeon]|nr:hypothetical protein [Candidatus Woesearchaeota archaeon]